jgi:hypothetical protein
MLFILDDTSKLESTTIGGRHMGSECQASDAAWRAVRGPRGPMEASACRRGVGCWVVWLEIQISGLDTKTPNMALFAEYTTLPIDE